jgi:hypothetical protein
MPTTSAFYFGDTLQHITEAALIPILKNYAFKSSSEKANVSVGPSITMASLVVEDCSLS